MLVQYATDARRTAVSGPEPQPQTEDERPGGILWLVGGALAIAAGTALGWDSASLPQIVTPPPAIRAVLIGLSVMVGIWLLVAALNRLAGDPDEIRVRVAEGREIGSMIRGVRLVFLAVAAFAAAAGWALGHPLPLVVALVIAGVDVLETSFLLLVVNLRSRR
jgi:hypothetical protein